MRAGKESELTFDVTRNGKPVSLQDYLGAKGHLVALHEGDLAFLHVHPDANSLRFAASFLNAGTYRLFLQFQVARPRPHRRRSRWRSPDERRRLRPDRAADQGHDLRVVREPDRDAS